MNCSIVSHARDTSPSRRFAWRAPIALAAILGSACGHSTPPVPSLTGVPLADTTQLVARGEYIVRTVASCGGCHGENHREDGPLSGGAEFKDWRLGTARAANLTPDNATGLGLWSDAEIVRALRNGVRKNGDLIAPVMPYEWLHDMSDADALAVARYLKSRPPVRNAVSQDFNFIFAVGRTFFIGPKKGDAPMPPPRGATAAYGGYLAQHVGLCADCHTPRGGLTNEPDKKQMFAGDAHPSKDFPANPSNLTPDSATGIGRWSEEDFVHTIRTGVNPHGDSLNPFMPWKANAHMTDDDLRAIYRYLRSLPAIKNEVPRRAPSVAANGK